MLSLHQQSNHLLFPIIFVYSSQIKPHWIAIFLICSLFDKLTIDKYMFATYLNILYTYFTIKSCYMFSPLFDPNVYFTTGECIIY